MSPKGPLAPAPSASEMRKERRFGWVIAITVLLALVPVLLIVLGYYPPSTAEELIDSTGAGDTLAVDSTVAEVPDVELPSPHPVAPSKEDTTLEDVDSAPVEQSLWRRLRAQLYAMLRKKDSSEEVALPAPAAGTDSGYVQALIDSAAKVAVSAPQVALSAPPVSSLKQKVSSSSSHGAVLSSHSVAVPPSRIVTIPDRERDSVRIVGFQARLSRPGVLVQGDLLLFSTEKGLTNRYPAFAPAVKVAIENIFYITQPENLKIPKLEALILQKVGFVFPQGAVSRVELRNLHTEWENR